MAFVVKLGTRQKPESCGFICETLEQVNGYLAVLSASIGLDHAWIYESLRFPITRIVHVPPIYGNPSEGFDIGGPSDFLLETRFLSSKRRAA